MLIVRNKSNFLLDHAAQVIKLRKMEIYHHRYFCRIVFSEYPQQIKCRKEDQNLNMQKARRRGIISNIFDRWPGRRIFGPYRFIPFFFFLGAALEFSMIKWTVGETNFYRVYKKNQVEKEARSIIEKEKLVQVNLNKDFDVLVQKKVEEIKEQEMRNNR